MTELPFRSLAKLFRDLFTADELRVFLRSLPEGKELDAALPGKDVPFNRLSHKSLSH